MLDFNEMVKTVEKEHKIKFRGYGRTKKQDTNCEGVYLDFWHEIVATHEISNPCEIEIDLIRILTFKQHFPDEDKSLLRTSALGKEKADLFIKERECEILDRNDISWKLDIISNINKSYPFAISADMKLNVFIEW